MSAADLEVELRAWREPDADVPPSEAIAMSVEDALARRNAGNLPDEQDRSLRLLLVIEKVEPGHIERERRRFEPDFHDAPVWRREGSKPVNVVPLLLPGVAERNAPERWSDDPTMGKLEEEWSASGAVSGLVIPEEWRGFVFKTIASLRDSGRDVTVDSIADSVARWLAPEEAERLRDALREANA